MQSRIGYVGSGLPEDCGRLARPKSQEKEPRESSEIEKPTSKLSSVGGVQRRASYRRSTLLISFPGIG